MIVATKNLKQYLKLAGLTNRAFAEKIKFDEVTVSQVLNQREGATISFIESVLNFTGMAFEKAFETKREKSRSGEV